MLIRYAQPEDHDAIWRILEPTIRAGATYALPRQMNQAEAIAYWTGPDRETFVAEEDGRLLGTYYLRSNLLGGGAHVANCGYMTASDARARRGALNVRTLTATRSRPRLQGYAIQRRC